MLDDVQPVEVLPPGAEFRHILVPMKLGDIGEEMVATAIALAKERGATIEAVFVVRVPRKYPLAGALPDDEAALPGTEPREGVLVLVDARHGPAVGGKLLRYRRADAPTSDDHYVQDGRSVARYSNVPSGNATTSTSHGA